MALDWMDEILEEIDATPEKSIINKANKNNHAGVERREASEKAEAILKLINEYRVYAHRFESLPTWDVLGFLNKLQNELFDKFGKDVENGELDKLRNDYFLMAHKKPFMAWGVDELKKRMEEMKAETDKENEGMSENYLSTYKKSQWKKALKK
jgi:hypothetical protein